LVLCPRNITKDNAKTWGKVNWNHARREVRWLQIRIEKATLEGRWNKVKTLQYLLTRSFHAKLLAVKRVTSNKPLALTVSSGGPPKPNGRLLAA